jgi:hypothetical protein
VADTGLLLNSTMALQFNDASQYINAPSNAILDINATDEIELNATLVDINANVEISGTATTTGVHTFTAVPVLPANSIDSAHYVDGSIDNAHIADDQIDSEHYAAASIDNEHLADNAVDTAEIADNAVSLAKMAGLARGKIIYGDSSGDPAALSVGSSGQALVSDGTDISWGAAGASLSGSTNNTVATVTGANALAGEANLTFDGTDLTLGTGNLVMGTSGKGVDFSATSDVAGMTSELLDDYEEGTFTLAMYAGQNGTITNTYAKYTKIGRNVTVNFYGNINDAEGNSFVRISGMPFAMNNSRVAVTIFYSHKQVIHPSFSAGGYFYYQNTTVGGNNQGEDASWLDSQTGMTFQATYIV